jgi:hypothetical protein
LGDGGEPPDNYIGLGDELNSDDNNVNDDDKNEVMLCHCAAYYKDRCGGRSRSTGSFIGTCICDCVRRPALTPPRPALPCPA